MTHADSAADNRIDYIVQTIERKLVMFGYSKTGPTTGGIIYLRAMPFPGHPVERSKTGEAVAEGLNDSDRYAPYTPREIAWMDCAYAVHMLTQSDRSEVANRLIEDGWLAVIKDDYLCIGGR